MFGKRSTHPFLLLWTLQELQFTGSKNVLLTVHVLYISYKHLNYLLYDLLFSMWRYKLILVVLDNTSDTKFIIYDNHVLELLNLPCLGRPAPSNKFEVSTFKSESQNLEVLWDLDDALLVIKPWSMEGWFCFAKLLKVIFYMYKIRFTKQKNYRRLSAA